MPSRDERAGAGRRGCAHLSACRWRSATRSTDQANCVEIALAGRTVAVRDSKNRTGAPLAFPMASWVAFLRML